MRTSFLSGRRWRIVTWITVLMFGVMFVYTAIQLYTAVLGGGA